MQPQQKRRLKLETYEYCLPFNYENITVHRNYRGREEHGERTE